MLVLILSPLVSPLPCAVHLALFVCLSCFRSIDYVTSFASSRSFSRYLSGFSMTCSFIFLSSKIYYLVGILNSLCLTIFNSTVTKNPLMTCYVQGVDMVLDLIKIKAKQEDRINMCELTCSTCPPTALATRVPFPVCRCGLGSAGTRCISASLSL